MPDLKFIKCENPKSEIKHGEFTDHMFRMYRKEYGGWYKNVIIPVDSHNYFCQTNGKAVGLTVTEAVRITLDKDGKAVIFRAKEYIERLNRNAKSVGIPEADAAMALYSLTELVKIERRFLTGNNVLLARMMLTADDNTFAADEVKNAEFTIVLESRDKSCFDGIRVCTSDNCILSSLVCGTAAYNLATHMGVIEAHKKNYHSVLWLDNVYKKYITRLSGSSLFVRMGDEVITPDNKDLGIMQDSVIKLMDEWGIKVVERKLSTDELVKKYREGVVTEAFCADTLGVVTPIDLIDHNGMLLEFEHGKLTRKLHDSILSIEQGFLPSATDWVTRV